VITRGIRHFVERDWQAVRANKDAYWRDRIARLGAAEALRIADELRRQVRLLNPDWPGRARRREDLLCHVHLAERLRRVGSASRR
jgi:hypothetical protein